MAIRRGHSGKVDGNHTAIVDALRQSGISAVSIASVGGGVPDILAGFRNVTALLEVKMPGEKLTTAEQEWHSRWGGHVAIVDSPEAAVDAVLRAVGMMR